MDQESWENICIQCGDCCFEKTIGLDNKIYHTSIPCRYLDVNTRLCKVYHKRFKMGEECINLTPAVVKSANWLSNSCAYMRHLRSSSRDKLTP